MLNSDATSGQGLPEKRSWGFWPTVGLSAVVLVTYFAVQLIISLVIFIFKARSTNPSLEQIFNGLATDGLILSIAIIFSASLGAALIAIFISLKGGISFADYLGFKKIKPRTIVLLVVLFIVMLSAVLIAGNFVADQADSTFMTDLYRSSVFPPLLWLAVAFFGPFFEELLFRGFLFVGLRASRLGTVLTIIVTSILWASLHIQYDLYGIIQILIIGLILGTVRHKTGSLWSSIIIHVLWNGAALAATAIYISSGGA
jgi:membrane protease YdiL (CAAX protease family)